MFLLAEVQEARLLEVSRKHFLHPDSMPGSILEIGYIKHGTDLDKLKLSTRIAMVQNGKGCQEGMHKLG